MSQIEKHKAQDEIDLSYLLNKLKSLYNSLLKSIYSIFLIFVKYKYILLFLLITGFALGIYQESFTKKTKSAKLLVRINFDGAEFVYNSIHFLNSKVSNKDKRFLEKVGLNIEEPEILKAEIKPVVKFKEIVNSIDDPRNADTFIRNIDFVEDEDDNILDIFITDFKEHYISLNLNHNANKNTLKNFLEYINQNEIMLNLKQVYIDDLQERINNNSRTIELVDNFLEKRSLENPMGLSDNQVYIDMGLNVNQIFTAKTDAQKENEVLKKELVFSKDVVVVLGEEDLFYSKSKLTDKKSILYPLIFITLFLLFVFLIRSFNYIKRVAEEN